MIRNRFLCLLVSLLVLSFGAGLHSEEHKFTPETFEKPDREKWQKPDQVVEALKLKQGNIVADIGAGSGYFTRRFARAVEPDGFVYATDIDENMLRYIHKQNQQNVITILCPPNDPMLPPKSVDLVFICDTIHHISNRADYYARLLQCLKPQGRLAIVDFQKKELPVGPPVQMKIAKEDLIKEITSAGFKLLEDLDFLPYQYFVVFGSLE